MSDNKLVKAFMDATTLTGLAAGIAGLDCKKGVVIKRTSPLTPAATSIT